MIDYPICKYRNVSERDMDLLFMEAFVTDPGFLSLFMDKLAVPVPSYTLLHAERSKVDQGLGESDITIIFDAEGNRKALLIENKIDAVAMPDQHNRYIKRGEMGVDNGEYGEFYVFVVCPEKYRENNEEAAKYEHFVSYEECRDYFSNNNDVYSRLRFQQICQALETMKTEYKVDINEIAVDSFQKYRAYQEAYYPRLKPNNKAETGKVNGWWPSYLVGVKGMYILHKTNFDCADLTISGAADRMVELQVVEKWLHDGGHTHIKLVKTGKSAAFRIMTPEIKMSSPFETWKMGDLAGCFEAIQELADLAAMFAVINSVIFRGRTGEKA